MAKPSKDNRPGRGVSLLSSRVGSSKGIGETTQITGNPSSSIHVDLESDASLILADIDVVTFIQMNLFSAFHQNSMMSFGRL